ncbi:MAG: chromate resistance protein [Candidatus Rokubacteria bacterium]|nr:chromate resistance protein [Candidatus Rokubacteria bacterium]
MRWLTLLMSLPPTPTRHRVGVWRKLRRLGAVKLRGAAWLLPETPETLERFQWLVEEIRSCRGDATLLRVDGIETMRDEEVAALFHKARAADYQPLVARCQGLLAQLDHHRVGPRGSLEPARARLDALKREFDRVRAIDYLEAPLGRRARQLWDRAARRLQEFERRPGLARGKRRAALPPTGSTWVTRPRPHIDRIASAWLIKRFLDPEAQFAFADPSDASEKGIPFDILGAEFGHHGEDCTFETLLKRFSLKDRRLRIIAEIVHEADLRDGKFACHEASGVDLMIQGMAATIHEDDELLERGMAVCDGLYAALKQRS